MATELQQNLAKEIVSNLKRKKPKNKKELVVSSGYSITTATKQIPAVFEQKGVLEALNDYGFNEDNAKRVVSEIMLNSDNDPNARLKATDQVFKVHSTYAPEKTTATNVNINISEKELEIAQEYELKLKEQL